MEKRIENRYLPKTLFGRPKILSNILKENLLLEVDILDISYSGAKISFPKCFEKKIYTKDFVILNVVNVPFKSEAIWIDNNVAGLKFLEEKELMSHWKILRKNIDKIYQKL